MVKNSDNYHVQTEKVPCAFCDSQDTELISLFGQFLLASQYYCHSCRSVFEAVRWKENPYNRKRSAEKETDGL